MKDKKKTQKMKLTNKIPNKTCRILISNKARKINKKILIEQNKTILKMKKSQILIMILNL
jgi:hypothetical protein